MINKIKKQEKVTLFLLVNLVTLIRVPLIVIFRYNLLCYLKFSNSINGIIAITTSILVLFSDFIDGKLARKYKVTSTIGQNLDIYLDFTYIIVSITILCVYNEINFYFVIVVIYKFLEFIVISRVFRGKYKCIKGNDYYYDLLGQLASVSFYIVPLVVICFRYFHCYYGTVIINLIVICITVFTCISSIVKIISCIKLYKR